MVRGKWILFAGIVVFAAAGTGAFVWYQRQAAAQKQADAAPAAPVELPRGAEVTLTGKIQAVHIVPVNAPIDGVLEEFAVKPGDEVFEGQILGRIANGALQQNEKEAQLEIERAQARLSASEAELTAARLEDSRLTAELSRARSEMSRNERNYQRQQMLYREGAAARVAYEKAEQEHKAARDDEERAQMLSAAAQERIQKVLRDIELARKQVAESEQAHDAAKNELAAADLLSPVDGLVLSIKKGSGEEVQKGMPGLIDLATDLSQLELAVEAPEAYTKRLAAGQAAQILIAELPGNGLTATIKAVEKDRIIVEFSSPSTLVQPGMTAAARFKLP